MKPSLLAFYLAWADRQGWRVPDVHVRVYHWLEHRGDLAVLRCHRGFGKSTALGIYNAWRFFTSRTLRILHQSESDGTAYRTSRDTQHILRNHPWTRGTLPPERMSVESWWLPEAQENDPRNPSMHSRGITSNVTSARADEIQNDDVEVPRNIQNPEGRERLRYRLGEQVHIAVPGSKRLFVGTPHTHDSVYDEMERLGADCLTIRMFEHEHRIENAIGTRYPVPFRPEFVFSGIGTAAQLLTPGTDYSLTSNGVEFAAPPGTLIDFYAGVAWPERFGRAELLKRRRETRTINEWDSQYQLHSKPVGEIRLDPARIQAYADEPRFVTANKVLTMWLGQVQIVGMSLRWDPSSGKVNSDVSGVVLDLQDAYGRHYWHRVIGLEGEIARTSDDGKRIIGGQVFALCDLIEQFRVPRVTVETNGIGGFAGNFLKMALKQRQLRCGVVEVQAVTNKGLRILEALEPIIVGGMLWAHADALDALWDQMKDWNPIVKNQPDDLLDAGAGAVMDQPARIGQHVAHVDTERDDWRPAVGVFEATLEA